MSDDRNARLWNCALADSNTYLQLDSCFNPNADAHTGAVYSGRVHG